MEKTAWIYLFFLTFIVSSLSMMYHWKSNKQKVIYGIQICVALIFEIIVEYYLADILFFQIISFVWLGVNVLFQYIYIFFCIDTK